MACCALSRAITLADPGNTFVDPKEQHDPYFIVQRMKPNNHDSQGFF